MNSNQFNPEDFYYNTIWKQNPNNPAATGLGALTGGAGGAGVLPGMGIANLIEPKFPNIKNYESLVNNLPEQDLKTFYNWYGQQVHENPMFL